MLPPQALTTNASPVSVCGRSPPLRALRLCGEISSTATVCNTNGGRLPPHMLRAYRQTDYTVGGITIRIGRRVPDTLFAATDSRIAVIVTAWNPMSRQMPRGWNHRMMRRLRQYFHRLAMWDATGSLRRWHEAMLLVVGDPRPVARLAVRFRQRAIVILRRGQPARLGLLSPRASCVERVRIGC